MLSAYDLGYVQSGEYVFIDVELFPFNSSYWGDHSWRRGDERDSTARLAYEAVLRIALHEPSGSHFDSFAEEVKTRALKEYGFDYDERGETVGG